MTEPKRCALLEDHTGPCAAWPNLPDTARPHQGARCATIVEPRAGYWHRAVTRGQLEREHSRRDVIARAIVAAKARGYRGRISFVKAATIGPPGYDMYELRIHALGGA